MGRILASLVNDLHAWSIRPGLCRVSHPDAPHFKSALLILDRIFLVQFFQSNWTVPHYMRGYYNILYFS